MFFVYPQFGLLPANRGSDEAFELHGHIVQRQPLRWARHMADGAFDCGAAQAERACALNLRPGHLEEPPKVEHLALQKSLHQIHSERADGLLGLGSGLE